MTEKKNLGKRLKRFIPLYLMMIPGAVYLIINNYIPMTGIVIAFKQFNYGKGIWGSPFIGFKNFEFLFATKDAWIITRNTLLYNVVFIVLGTACAIMNAANEEAAWAFLRGENSFNGIHRTVEAALDRVAVKYRPSLADILEADRLAREAARAVLSR